METSSRSQAASLEDQRMPDYLFLMHNDAVDPVDQALWHPYLARLQETGVFQGGSEIGVGICVRKTGPQPGFTGHITGYVRVACASLGDAHSLVRGNPVFEAGGTVEIRELPHS